MFKNSQSEGSEKLENIPTWSKFLNIFTQSSNNAKLFDYESICKLCF